MRTKTKSKYFGKTAGVFSALIMMICLNQTIFSQKCVWIGQSLQNSSEWSNPENWFAKQIPDIYDDVEIVSYPKPLAYPVISLEDTVGIRSLTIKSGAEITINGLINITEDLIMEGSSNWGSYIDLQGVINFNPSPTREEKILKEYREISVHDKAKVKKRKTLYVGENIINNSSEIFYQDGSPLVIKHKSENKKDDPINIGYIGYSTPFRMFNSNAGLYYTYNLNHYNENRMGLSVSTDIEYSFYKAVHRKNYGFSVYLNIDFMQGNFLNETNQSISSFSNSFALLWSYNQIKIGDDYITSNLLFGLSSRKQIGYEWLVGLRWIFTPLTIENCESYLDVIVSPFTERVNKRIICESKINLPFFNHKYYMKTFFEYNYLINNLNLFFEQDPTESISFGVAIYYVLF